LFFKLGQSNNWHFKVDGISSPEQTKKSLNLNYQIKNKKIASLMERSIVRVLNSTKKLF